MMQAAESTAPAFSYYGGKQRMAGKIIPLIPMHTVYVEPFAGGAAIFFGKPWPNISNSHFYREVINDTDDRIINFYRVLRDDPDRLVHALSLTPYSRTEYVSAGTATEDDVENARRWYVDIQQSYANKSRAGWGFGTFGVNPSATWVRKCLNLAQIAERMMGVFIEHDDALTVIERWDSPQTFFYCDPPYPGTNQGHYASYTSEDFRNLVSVLDGCHGSFILSNYDQPDMPAHWERFEFSAYCSAIKTNASNLESYDCDRTEIVWRMVRGDNVKPEIKKLYESGAFDCFTGNKRMKRQQSLFG